VSASEGVRVDPHVKVLDERVVRRAKRRGLDVLVYAPHFTQLPTIRRRARRFSDDELLVVPGREVFTGDWRTRKHVLAVGLDEPVPDFITLDRAMAALDRQDAAVLVPHPEFLTVSLDERDVRTYADTVDAVEVYNPKHFPSHNRRAQAVARAVDRPAFASSYAHLPASVGEVWTTVAGEIADEGDLVDALVEGWPRRVYHRRGRVHHLRCLAEFAHLGYENSVEKVDRVVLSDREPTHPSDPIYDGRFDDACVY
jgi:predicted metal-dependent phosphoesterase TrpH